MNIHLTFEEKNSVEEDEGHEDRATTSRQPYCSQLQVQQQQMHVPMKSLQQQLKQPPPPPLPMPVGILNVNHSNLCMPVPPVLEKKQQTLDLCHLQVAQQKKAQVQQKKPLVFGNGLVAREQQQKAVQDEWKLQDAYKWLEQVQQGKQQDGHEQHVQQVHKCQVRQQDMQEQLRQLPHQDLVLQHHNTSLQHRNTSIHFERDTITKQSGMHQMQPLNHQVLQVHSQPQRHGEQHHLHHLLRCPQHLQPLSPPTTSSIHRVVTSEACRLDLFSPLPIGQEHGSGLHVDSGSCRPLEHPPPPFMPAPRDQVVTALPSRWLVADAEREPRIQMLQPSREARGAREVREAGCVAAAGWVSEGGEGCFKGQGSVSSGCIAKVHAQDASHVNGSVGRYTSRVCTHRPGSGTKEDISTVKRARVCSRSHSRERSRERSREMSGQGNRWLQDVGERKGARVDSSKGRRGRSYSRSRSRERCSETWRISPKEHKGTLVPDARSARYIMGDQGATKDRLVKEHERQSQIQSNNSFKTVQRGSYLSSLCCIRKRKSSRSPSHWRERSRERSREKLSQRDVLLEDVRERKSAHVDSSKGRRERSFSRSRSRERSGEMSSERSRERSREKERYTRRRPQEESWINREGEMESERSIPLFSQECPRQQAAREGGRKEGGEGEGRGGGRRNGGWGGEGEGREGAGSSRLSSPSGSVRRISSRERRSGEFEIHTLREGEACMASTTLEARDVQDQRQVAQTNGVLLAPILPRPLPYVTTRPTRPSGAHVDFPAQLVLDFPEALSSPLQHNLQQRAPTTQPVLPTLLPSDSLPHAPQSLPHAVGGDGNNRIDFVQCFLADSHGPVSSRLPCCRSATAEPALASGGRGGREGRGHLSGVRGDHLSSVTNPKDKAVNYLSTHPSKSLAYSPTVTETPARTQHEATAPRSVNLKQRTENRLEMQQEIERQCTPEITLKWAEKGSQQQLRLQRQETGSRIIGFVSIIGVCVFACTRTCVIERACARVCVEK